MNRASIYEGACLENYINYVVNYIVDIKLVAKENVPYVLPNGFEDDNLRYTPVSSGDGAKTLEDTCNRLQVNPELVERFRNRMGRCKSNESNFIDWINSKD